MARYLFGYPNVKISIFKVTNYTVIVNLNPFVPNASFLYPLKTSENFKVS